MFELPRVQGLLTPFFKDLTDIIELHTLHRLIIGIVQRIQFSLLPQEDRHPFLVTQRPKGFEVEILRMQGESGNDVIGIGVAPGARGCCIIDWQQLDDLHPRCHSPIYEQAEIAEVAHPTGMATTKREHRHTDTSSAPRILLHPQALTIDHQHRPVRNSGLFGREHTLDRTVVAFLPSQECVGGIIDDHKLELQRQQDGIDIHGKLPLTES